MNNLDEAAKYLNDILGREKSHSGALSSLGWINFLEKDYQNAERLLLQALEVEESYLHLFRLGRVYKGLDQPQKSLTCFLKSAKANPQFSEVFGYLGDYYLTVDNDAARAEKCYQKALQLDTSNPVATESLSKLLISQGRIDDTELLLKNYCGYNSRNFWANRLLGFLESNRGRHQEAVQHLQHAVRVSEKDAMVWECLAENFYHIGKFSSALKALDRAEEQPNVNVESVSYLNGVIKAKLGLFSDAVYSFEETLRINPKHAPTITLLCDCFVKLSEDLREQGSKGAGEENLLKAMKVLLAALDLNVHSTALFKTMGDVFWLLYRYVPEDKFIGDSSLLQFQLVTEEMGSRILGLFSNDLKVSDLNVPLRYCFLAYTAALRFIPDADALLQASLYLDISLILLELFDNIRNDSLYFTAIKFACFGLNLSPTSGVVWNYLGVLLSKRDSIKAQHAFIRSILISESAGTWSNLGLLYLENKDPSLAQQAFMKAHLLDSEEPKGWLGRSLVAKQTGRDFASIVAHAQDVSQGTCLELNYQYLLHLCKEKDSNTNTLYAELGRLLNSLDNKAQKDYRIWNLIGVVYERIGNFDSAIYALDTSLLHSSSEEDKLAAQSNLARLYLAADKLEKSLSTSLIVNQTGRSDLLSLFVEGLAFYFIGDIQGSLSTFERAFATGSSNSQLMSQAHLCLGKIVNALGSQEGVELSKEQLFQSYTLDPNNREAMYSLLSTGLQTSDATLIQSVLQEIVQPVFEKKDLVIEDAYVLSRYALITRDPVWAKKLCEKALHLFPSNFKIWHSLAKILIK